MPLPNPGARQIAFVRTAVLVAVFKETGSGAAGTRHSGPARQFGRPPKLSKSSRRCCIGSVNPNLPQRRLPALQIAHESAEGSSATVVPMCKAHATFLVFPPAWSHAVQFSGGRKMQTICFTLPQPRIHACMRLSFDSRRRRSRGTIAVPCFVVTESCGKLPSRTGRVKAQLSTGTQSFARQHSSGYQSCASAGVTRLGMLAVRMRHAPARDR
jgi:hypothetical protein